MEEFLALAEHNRRTALDLAVAYNHLTMPPILPLMKRVDAVT